MANGSTPLTWFEARMAVPLHGMCSVPTRRHPNVVRRMSSVPIMVRPHQGSPSTHERKRAASPPASMRCHREVTTLFLLGHHDTAPEDDMEVGRPRPFPFVQAHGSMYGRFDGLSGNRKGAIGNGEGARTSPA